ncbi:MAG: hypothetical protein K6G52_03300 [Treponemataceae bacterium]|nr:hypothetical protein [Treponemataceae bacterium]
MERSNDTEVDQQAKEFIEKSHQILVDSIESYFKSGYITSLAKMLFYAGEDNAENLLSKLDQGTKEKVLKKYQKLISDENLKISDPEILAEVLPLFHKSGNSGNKLYNKLSKIASNDLLLKIATCEDEFFDVEPVVTMNIENETIKFTDLLFLDDRAFQRLLREVDAQDLTVALYGANESIKNKVFRNMSRRAATNLKEDIEFLGEVPLERVNETRQKICKILRTLIKREDIYFSKGSL